MNRMQVGPSNSIRHWARAGFHKPCALHVVKGWWLCCDVAVPSAVNMTCLHFIGFLCSSGPHLVAFSVALVIYLMCLSFMVFNGIFITTYHICDRLCENRTCRGINKNAVYPKIGGKRKFMNLLIMNSPVSLGIVLSIR